MKDDTGMHDVVYNEVGTRQRGGGKAVVVELLSCRQANDNKICCRQAVDKSYLRFGVKNTKNIGMLRTQRQPFSNSVICI